MLGGVLKLFDESGELTFSPAFLRNAQKEAGVDGGDDGGGEVGEVGGLEAALGEDFEVVVDEGLGGGAAEGDDDLGFDLEDFREDPGFAVMDFLAAGFVVEPSFAARIGFPFEVFDGVGEIEVVAVEAGFLQGFVEQLPGGADEGATLEVLAVAGLFADEHDAGVAGAFASDGLGRAFPEGAEERRFRRDSSGSSLIFEFLITWFFVKGRALGVVCGSAFFDRIHKMDRIGFAGG
jgi:hypothetical protein